MNEVTNAVVERPYKFRQLNATDIAPMCKIISKIGINEFTKCFESESILAMITNAKDKKKINDIAGIQVFLEMVNVIVSHIPDCEKELFNLLASVSEMPVEDVKAFDLPTITRMIVDFVKKEEFKDFIGVVSELFK